MVDSSRITSRQNSHVKDAVRLRRGHERRQQKRFLIDGAREITRAIEAGIRPRLAFVCEEFCKSDDCKRAISQLEALSAEVLLVSPDVFARLAFGDRQDGVVVVAEVPSRNLSAFQLPAQPLVAVIEGIEKPGNVGAVLRSADAAGVDAVVVADGRTDLFNPNTIRASLGTVFGKNVFEASSVDTIRWLREKNILIVTARPDARLLYTDVDLRGGVAIVLGSEATGLSEAWNTAGAIAVRLPMHGLADSLNVSATAAVLFYEALRQRGSPSSR